MIITPINAPLSHGVIVDYTCISGPAVEMVAIVSDPIASTMFLNFPVSISDNSRALTISSSFCSLIYFNSASRALVKRSRSDSYLRKRGSFDYQKDTNR